MITKSRLKYIQSLGQKKHRDEAGVFIAEGPKLIKELLQNPNAELQQLLALNAWIDANQQLLGNIPAEEISESELERISQLTTPHDVLGIFKKFETGKPIITGAISLVLDGIRDPGNLGTIIRTADWFGISKIICSDDCADIYNPKVVQATMGSIARVAVYYTDLPGWINDEKVQKYAAVLDGKDVAVIGKMQEGMIMIGNESSGLDPQLLAYATERITVPRIGKAESLNAAVATGIILSHLVQRPVSPGD